MNSIDSLRSFSFGFRVGINGSLSIRCSVYGLDLWLYFLGLNGGGVYSLYTTELTRRSFTRR